MPSLKESACKSLEKQASEEALLLLNSSERGITIQDSSLQDYTVDAIPLPPPCPKELLLIA